MWIYLDPLGAVLVSLYIAYTWYKTGVEHTGMLSGKTADPDFRNRIIAVWPVIDLILQVCLDHDERIRFIDTVYVYHFGTRFLVEAGDPYSIENPHLFRWILFWMKTCL